MRRRLLLAIGLMIAALVPPEAGAEGRTATVVAQAATSLDGTWTGTQKRGTVTVEVTFAGEKWTLESGSGRVKGSRGRVPVSNDGTSIVMIGTYTQGGFGGLPAHEEG